MKEKEMLSSAHVNAALTRTMNDSFLNKIRVAGKDDERWQDRGRELIRLRESGKKMPDEWIEKDGLLYYKNRLYFPEDEALQTEIAQGCHDSLVKYRCKSTRPAKQRQPHYHYKFTTYSTTTA